MTTNHKDSKTEFQEWIVRRVREVESHISMYDILTSNNIDIPEERTDFQISCPLPGHGPDNRPSARYYGSGQRPHFFCFKCKVRLDSINLYAKFRGLRFMDALADLEKRFRIKIPRRPEGPEIVEPSERKSEYVSDKWSDVPRVLAILEKKLISIRDRCGMSDYVKFCRLIDSVQYDYDKTQVSTPEMVSVLMRAISMVNDITALPENLNVVSTDADPPG